MVEKIPRNLRFVDCCALCNRSTPKENYARHCYFWGDEVHAYQVCDDFHSVEDVRPGDCNVSQESDQ